MIADRRTPPALEAIEPTLRDVVDALVRVERGAGSPGEAYAARWLAERLEQAGADARIEPARYLPGYADLIGALAGAGALGGLLGLSTWSRPRKLGALLAAASGALIADDISNAWRLARKRREPRETQNVVALAGDRTADRTLVVLAHHDAARTGAVFDDRLQALACELAPGILERIDTSLPLWWGVLAGPAAAALGAITSNRKLTASGIAASLIATAVFADIARSPIVPGANDNLSAVAVLVALAERLQVEPVTGLRVLLVSVGAEEVLQGGIHAFAERHFQALDRERTWFLVLDTVGSPELVLVEGEGPVVMEDYFDRSFRDLVARAAEQIGAPVRRGLRARNSTDAVIPARAGYPTALLTSINRHKALANYHQPTDVAEQLVYRTVVQTALVTEAVARQLAANPWLRA